MSIDRPLTLSCNSYDVAAALLDGYPLQTRTGADISRLFEQVVRDRAFDVAELDFTFLARTMTADNPPFYAAARDSPHRCHGALSDRREGLIDV
jgi:hypothetical protein